MKSNTWITVLLLSLFVNAAPASAKNLVFLMAGQSNMAGHGVTNQLVKDYPQYPAIQPNIKLWTGATGGPAVSNGWVNLQGGYGNTTSDFGPEITFGYTLQNLYPKDNIYLIKYSDLGSILALPNPGVTTPTWNPDGGPGSEYANFLATADTALATVTSPTIGGMIWMQGAGDSSVHTYADAYQANLENFITSVRTDFSAPALPFVLGQIDWDHGNYTGIIRDAQAAVAADPTLVNVSDRKSVV
jgi:hypothetical protein